MIHAIASGRNPLGGNIEPILFLPTQHFKTMFTDQKFKYTMLVTLILGILLLFAAYTFAHPFQKPLTDEEYIEQRTRHDPKTLGDDRPVESSEIPIPSHEKE